MRNLLLVAFLVVGCGEVSPAGVALEGTGGAAGGEQDSGGAGGSAGTAGSAGTTGAAGATGSGGASPPSCNIPIDQVNGEDNTARWTASGAGTLCSDQNRVVTVTGGACAGWTLSSYAPAPSPNGPGLCHLELTFTRTSASCDNERLFVQLTVAAL